MAVTIEAPVAAGGGSWRLNWSSTLSSPTFYVWRDGQLVAVTSAVTMIFWVAPGESLVIEVFDSATETPSSAYPGRLTLAWERSAATDYYRIDLYTGGQWVEQARVFDTGAFYYSWKTDWLDDVTQYRYRAVPIGVNGNAGASREFSVLMVRTPDEPSIAYGYSAVTNKVTVSAT